MWLLLVPLAIAIIWGFASGASQIRKNKANTKNAQSAFEHLPGFHADDSYLSTTSGQSIGYDNKAKRICFLDAKQNPFIYNYNQILQCEVVVDGKTTLKQSIHEPGQGVFDQVLGGGNSTFGRTTITTTEKQKVSSIDLKVTINDTVNPLFKVNFLNLPTDKGSFLYRTAHDRAEKWHGILAGLIRQGSNQEIIITQPQANSSVADELKKLNDLVNSGVLTKEEFDKQKSKLIG